MIRDQELAGLAMTLGRDARIKITVGGNDSYCKPDGSHINIARMPSTPLGRMLMTGLVFHEIGHKNHTNGNKPDGLLGDMVNVIEDIRVDMETIKERPGTCFNLEAVTTHYIKKGSLEPNQLSHALLGKVMAYGFGKILKQNAIVPLEAICNEMMDDAFGQQFINDVDTIIHGIPKLKSTKDTMQMALKLINLLIQRQTPPSPPPSQRQQQGKENHGQSQNSAQGGSGNPSQDATNQNGPDAGNSVQQQHQPGDNDGTGQEQQPAKKDDQQLQGEKIETTGAGGNGAGSGGGKRPSAEEIKRMLDAKTGYGDLSNLIQSELNDMAACLPQKEKSGIPVLPEVGRLKPGFGKLDEVEAISASSRMRAKLMGLLQSTKRQPKSFGLSGRKLAPGRLVKLVAGDPRIFKKKIETVAANTAVTVLLDLSGSMDDKYMVANAAAFSLHNTLFGLKGVSVCSLEFSGKGNQPEVNVLVNFGRKPVSENFNHHPFDGTPTHTAIWAGRVMLLQRPEPRKIMLILTDGCPCNGAETQAATKRTMKDGIEIAAIGILDNSVRKFWDNHRIINTIQELPAAMFGVMEGLLVKLKR